MSTSRVFCPSRANPAARLMLDVVLPVPPLCVEKLRIIRLYRVYTLDISIDSVYPCRRASKKNFKSPDFSVVVFRLHFMLASEDHPMKVHKNQWLLTQLSSPDIPCGAPH